MSKVAYTKAALTYTQQLSQLKERGLTIPNEEYLIERIKKLLIKYPNIHPFAMGFPENWEKEPLWK